MSVFKRIYDAQDVSRKWSGEIFQIQINARIEDAVDYIWTTKHNKSTLITIQREISPPEETQKNLQQNAIFHPLFYRLFAKQSAKEPQGIRILPQCSISFSLQARVHKAL